MSEFVTDNITQDDVQNMRIFGVEQGDITGWIEWANRESVVEVTYPHLVYMLGMVDNFKPDPKMYKNTMAKIMVSLDEIEVAIKIRGF